MVKTEDEKHLAASIPGLEQELNWAEQKLRGARDALKAAGDEELHWRNEVDGLRMIVEARRARLNMGPAPIISSAADGSRDSDENQTLSMPVNVDGSAIDWIYMTVAASGTQGMTPPQVRQAAVKAGVAMHPNYVYVALRKLVDERKTLVKKAWSYYKKGLEGEEIKRFPR
jgi:hypothetical protein